MARPTTPPPTMTTSTVSTAGDYICFAGASRASAICGKPADRARRVLHLNERHDSELCARWSSRGTSRASRPPGKTSLGTSFSGIRASGSRQWLAGPLSSLSAAGENAVPHVVFRLCAPAASNGSCGATAVPARQTIRNRGLSLRQEARFGVPSPVCGAQCGADHSASHRRGTSGQGPKSAAEANRSMPWGWGRRTRRVPRGVLRTIRRSGGFAEDWARAWSAPRCAPHPPALFLTPLHTSVSMRPTL